MNPTILQEINLLRDFFNQQQDLGIVIGSHQTLDTVAAALSLYLSFALSGKKVQIISKKEPTVEVSSLVGIDKVGKNFAGATTKLVVSLPYIKGEVEKVLFTEAPDTINFHLTAAQGRTITHFENRDVRLAWEGGAPSALITLGVGNIDELAGINSQNTKIVNIDNYQGNSRFGDVVLVDESFSSLSEVAGKIIKELQLTIDQDVAQNILDGIMFGTRGFTKNNTSPIAFEIASYAMYQGAKRQEMRPQRETQQQPRSNQNQPRQQHQDRQDHPAFFMQNNRSSMNPQTPRPQARQETRKQFSNPEPEEVSQPMFNPSQDMNQNPQPQNTEPSASFENPQTEEIPEDWLMPKVFKSSKGDN